jgi:hypothetical protein
MKLLLFVFIIIPLFLAKSVSAQDLTDENVLRSIPNAWRLSGIVFEDTNGNGVRDGEELPMESVEITINKSVLVNGNNQITPPSTFTTKKNGFYFVPGIVLDREGRNITSRVAGISFTITAKVNPPAGYEPTNGSSVTVNLSSRTPRFPRYNFGLKPPLCRTVENIPTDPKGSLDDAVVAPSLLDDRQIAQKLMDLTMPGELMLEYLSSPQSVAIGVRRGFPRLACNLGEFPSVNPNISFNFCRKVEDLTLMLDSVDTDLFTRMVRSVISAKRPKEVQPKPKAQDCFLSDVKEASGSSQRTFGNKDIDDINTSLGTNQGYYIVDQPNLPNIPAPDTSKNNLSLQQRVFNADQRVPDINQKCELYSKAHYPIGISPCSSTEATFSATTPP